MSTFTRRSFIQSSIAACTLGSIPRIEAQQQVPVGLTSPNILLIVVDQMRFPVWMNATQSQLFREQIMPNLHKHIVNKSAQFNQYYTAAAACSPARATMLTGLYTHQTAMQVSSEDPTAPSLNPVFPTWGRAIPQLNPAYTGKVWWFGKWHLSANKAEPSPLEPYGFHTDRYPSATASSPNGWPNQGANGGLFTEQGIYSGSEHANDAQIVDSFTNWARQQSAAGPWCTTVSLINPHDIAGYPRWFTQDPNRYLAFAGASTQDVHFRAPAPDPTSPRMYTQLPWTWNKESLSTIDSVKPKAQRAHVDYMNKRGGTISTDAQWIDFLNTYYDLHRKVDQQIGRIFAALSPEVLAKTVVVFTSDHGEYGGSHGLRGKAGAAYEEGIHVPLYVRFPSLTTTSARNQLASSVDLFGLMCDLATRGSGAWRTKFPDLANRESLYSFVFNPSEPERKRLLPVAGVPQPYILHTVDEAGDTATTSTGEPIRGHIASIRLKSTTLAGQAGAKYAAYSRWAPGTNVPDGTGIDEEFYDYGNSHQNRSELGNNLHTTDAASVQILNTLRTAVNNLSSSELKRKLVGTGLSLALEQARQQDYAFRQEYRA